MGAARTATPPAHEPEGGEDMNRGKGVRDTGGRVVKTF